MMLNDNNNYAIKKVVAVFGDEACRKPYQASSLPQIFQLMCEATFLFATMS